MKVHLPKPGFCVGWWRGGRLWLATAVAVSAIATTAGLGIAQILPKADQPLLLAKPAPVGGPDTTLHGAVEAAESLMSQWGPGWVITAVDSTDVDDAPSEMSGADGRRRSWHVVAAGARGEERWIRVVAGQPVQAIVAADPGQTVSRAPGPINARQAIDSDRAVSIALARVTGLAGEPGPKATGIHFSLGHDPISGQPILTVSGRAGANTVRVELDAMTGAVSAAERLTFGSALYRSSDAGSTWSRVADAAAPLAVASGRGGTFYSAALDGTTVAIFRHVGPTTARVASLPGEAGSWVRGLAMVEGASVDELVVAAEHDLWTVRLPDGVVSRLAEGTFLRVAAPGGNPLHVVRVDGPGSTSHLAADATGRLSPVPEAAPPDKLAVLASRVVILGPDSAQRFGVADLMAIAGGPRLQLAASAPAGIYMSVNGGGSWEASKFQGKGLVVEIVVAPDWERSGVALAREYRGSIWRSSDGGSTWSAALQGAGQLLGLAFDDAGNAIAITSGGQLWLPY